jgi:Ca2+/H+ antiporter
MPSERFVSQSENDKVVKDTFILFGYSITSILIVITLLWSYSSSTYNNQYLFIAVYSMVIILYAVVIISLVVMNKEKYDLTSYKILFGTTLFTIFLTFFIGVFFIYKYSSSSTTSRSSQLINYTYRN